MLNLLARIPTYGNRIHVSDSEPDYPLNPTELDIVMDAVHGTPRKRTAAKGITDMEDRIKLLTTQKGACLEQMANPLNDPSRDTALTEQLASINRDLREATERLREYQVQLANLN
jgi:hypothetical protein